MIYNAALAVVPMSEHKQELQWAVVLEVYIFLEAFYNKKSDAYGIINNYNFFTPSIRLCRNSKMKF